MARLNRLKLNVSILDYIFCFTRKITWYQHQWWNPVNARVFIRSTWTPFPQTGMSTQPVHDKGRMENFMNELSVTLVSTITCIHCFVESFSLALISYNILMYTMLNLLGALTVQDYWIVDPIL
jgi:hypothetical protein